MLRLKIINNFKVTCIELKSYQKKFDSADLDGNGFLDIDEFRYMCTQELGYDLW